MTLDAADVQTWRPARSVAGALGLGAVLALLALSALVGWAAAQHLAQAFNLLVFGYALLAGLLALAAACLAYVLYGYLRLRYRLDRNALVIQWAGLRQVVPLGRIRQAAAAATLPAAAQPAPRRSLRWPGLWVGATRTGEGTPVLAYATAPLARQVLLITPTVVYAISPADPAAFLAALAARQAAGPITTPRQGSDLTGWVGHPLLRDRPAVGLVLAGLVLNVALFGYLAWVYPQLPNPLSLHWNIQGIPDRSGDPSELLRLPLIALALWVADLGAAALVHRRERLAALFLYAGGAVVQVIFWAAVLTIVLHALAGGG